MRRKDGENVNVFSFEPTKTRVNKGFPGYVLPAGIKDFKTASL